MSTDLVIGSKLSNLHFYEDVFGEILSFLGPKDLGRAEAVCCDWRKCIENQWKRQCQDISGFSIETDPKEYLPGGPSYKKIFELISPSILNGSVYRRYIGEVGPVPRIPEAISLKKWNEPDPCDSTKTVGTEYVWMYCPPYIETNLEGFSLDKPDDPNDLEAPKLIYKEEELSENKALRVPVTINNIVELFERPKTGNPSTYNFIWDKVVEQHGNKRIPVGWICMRKNVIGRNLLFAQQQALANEKGVILPQLLHSILFNFLEQVRSRRANVYPDGQGPYTFARTSTLTRDSHGNDWPSCCGAGDSSGLYVREFHLFDIGNVGVAVALPEKVHSIGP